MPIGLYEKLRRAILAGLLGAQGIACAYAGTLEVTVLDPADEPVPDVAVYVSYASGGPKTMPGTAVMDQKDTRFVPHMLVVQKGTSVEFPNSDVVAHHVYSFSKPNDFALALYKGDPHDPITFQHDGIVTLGCNIHDHMLAYIVVVDSDAYGKTGKDGRVAIDLDDTAKDATLHIWSPRIRDKKVSRAVSAASQAVTFTLEKKLRPAHDPGEEVLQWSEY